MGQGYEHPGPANPRINMYNALHKPHSGMSNILCFDSIGIESSETIALQETQVALNVFLKDCHEGIRGIETESVRHVGVGGHGKASGCCCAGVGGHRESSGNCAGVGGESSGGARRTFCGKE